MPKVSTADIRSAAAILRAGGLAAFPTETVYGLGADARSEAAVAALYRIKGRPAGHPVIVHAADFSAAAREWAAEIPEIAGKLAARFMPGPPDSDFAAPSGFAAMAGGRRRWNSAADSGASGCAGAVGGVWRPAGGAVGQSLRAGQPHNRRPCAGGVSGRFGFYPGRRGMSGGAGIGGGGLPHSGDIAPRLHHGVGDCGRRRRFAFARAAGRARPRNAAASLRSANSLASGFSGGVAGSWRKARTSPPSARNVRRGSTRKSGGLWNQTRKFAGGIYTATCGSWTRPGRLQL